MRPVVKMMHPKNETFNKFVVSIEDAVTMLDTLDGHREAREVTRSEPLPSLLEQCREMAVEANNAKPEPIRTIHHFACTGGTLITKCLACSPNIHVLSEVDPLSTLTPAGGMFAPGDLLRLVEFSNRKPSGEEKIELFLAGIENLHETNCKKGLRLLIRDHAHSHFCVNDFISERPTLRELIAERFHVLSIVTVRNPIDSYLSLLHNRWVHFEPVTIEEYAFRYERFIEHYEAEKIFRYEDLIKEPDAELEKMCEILDLPFPHDFQKLFSVHKLSGGSGRNGVALTPRPRREIPNTLAREIKESRSMQRLCSRLGYELEYQKFF